MPTCPKCYRFFDRSWDLSRHQAKKIPCDRNRCSNCRVIFATPYTLQTHLDNQVCLKPPKPKSNDVSIKPPSDQHIATIRERSRIQIS